VAEVVAGICTSHVPAVGVAIDQGRESEPKWAPYFEKITLFRRYIDRLRPDVCVIAYNDHASAFSLELIPTFAIGVASEFPPADEGYGPRQVPNVEGHPELAWHLAESLILDEFDMTIANSLPVDHGLTVPLSVMYDRPVDWPCRVVPICVNVIQYPPPTGRRCLALGRAVRRAIETFAGEERVAVVGTGGMSHQLQGERAGLINGEWDLAFMDMLRDDPAAAAAITHTEYIREAGSEGIELVMWHIARGALDPQVREALRVNHIPTSNTSNGVLVLENA
jgi:hypothetical protein